MASALVVVWYTQIVLIFALKARMLVRAIMMVFADYAAVEPQTGKLNVIGVFNRIAAVKFPTTHHRMYMALKFEGEFADSSRAHKLSATLANEDGVDILGLQGEFRMPDSPPGIPPQIGLVLELNQLQFDRPGDYRFYVAVNDGELDDSSVLQLVRIEQ